MFRYTFNFTFWGTFNERSTKCTVHSFHKDCASAVLLIGITRSGAMPTPSSIHLVPDLLLFAILCLHKLSLESLGLWRYQIVHAF